MEKYMAILMEFQVDGASIEKYISWVIPRVLKQSVIYSTFCKQIISETALLVTNANTVKTTQMIRVIG